MKNWIKGLTASYYKFALLVFAFFLFGATAVFAGVNDNVAGYAWSSNIGWIKLNNCTNPGNQASCSGTDYGVSFQLAAPGTGSGYAWSSNIGWISFNDASTNDATCPSGHSPCRGAYIDWTNANPDGSRSMKGWARACSVFVSGCSGPLKSNTARGDWDGYIALSDPTGSGAWGVRVLPNKQIVGYAWGSEVIGWVKFDTSLGGGAQIFDGTPTITISADPYTIASGELSVLTLNAIGIKDANSCNINGTPIVMVNNGTYWEGTMNVNPTMTTTYTGNCIDAADKVMSASTIVKVLTNITAITSFTSSGTCLAQNGKPLLSWTTDAAIQSCVLKRAGASNETVPTNVTDFEPNAGANTNPTTYTLECKTASGSTFSRQTSVSWCAPTTPDYSMSVSPAKQPLSAGTINKKVAVITITVNPTNGFGTDGEDVSLSYVLPAGMPPSTQATLSDSVLSYTGSGKFETATLTITIDAAEVPSNPDWLIQITGTYAPLSLSHSGSSLISAKKQIIFEEF